MKRLERFEYLRTLANRREAEMATVNGNVFFKTGDLTVHNTVTGTFRLASLRDVTLIANRERELIETVAARYPL